MALFGFLKARPPVDPAEQKWIDGRFNWLLGEFGTSVPREAKVVLPTEEFFPDPYDASDAAVEKMFIRVCGYMCVDPGRFSLFFYSGASRPPMTDRPVFAMSDAAGLYIDGQPDGRAAIGIDATLFSEPTSLVATMAHEIGHELLLGQKRVSPEQADHEPLTDLLTVFMGLGIFTANSTIHDRGFSAGLMVGWQTGRQGYLNQRNFGYALARFAFERGETAPGWGKHVRPDVRAPMNEGLKFLVQSRRGA